MAIPSGSGTEVLKFSYKNGVQGDINHVMITGVANHIYTILSATATEMEGDTGKTISMLVGGIHVLYNHVLGPHATFTWNDRLVISGAVDFEIRLHQSSWEVDLTCSYIDQDWT